jgi:hypothetical protein
MGQTSLLTPAEEVTLAKQIEAGRVAETRLVDVTQNSQWDKSVWRRYEQHLQY